MENEYNKLQELRDDFERFKREVEQRQMLQQYSMSFRDLQDFIEVVSAVPTHTPSNAYDQIKLYVNGATKELYICNNSVNPVVWLKVAVA